MTASHVTRNADKSQAATDGCDGGFVYLFSIDDRYYKIGRSADPVKRTKAFVQLPFETRLVHTVFTADPSWLEKYLHRAFAHCLVRGEWFRLKKSQVRLLCKCKIVLVEKDLPSPIRKLYCDNGGASVVLILRPPPSSRKKAGRPIQWPPQLRRFKKYARLRWSHNKTKYNFYCGPWDFENDRPSAEAEQRRLEIIREWEAAAGKTA